MGDYSAELHVTEMLFGDRSSQPTHAHRSDIGNLSLAPVFSSKTSFLRVF